MGSKIYNRKGEEITTDEWMELTKDDANRRVGASNAAGFEVSTVCLFLDHAFDEGPPLIFETMIFWHGKGVDERDQDCWRYCTEKQAIDGHAAVVAWLEGGGERPE